MRRLLLVCYYFPPLGLAGVSRPMNLFKQFPALGYACDILTVKPVAYRKYAPELLEGLDQTKIHRAGSRDPQRLMYLLGIREVNPKTIARGAKVGESLFPDSKIGWVNAAVRLGRKLHEKNPYDAIISTSPPISAHLVGMRLAEECGIKWVADFRDFWSVGSIEATYRLPKLVERANILKGEIVRRSAAVVGVNRAITQYLGAGEVISNGFDPEVAKLWGQPDKDGIFLIGLLGTFTEDISVAPLFQVISGAIAQKKIAPDRIQMLQVGEVDKEWLSREAEKAGLGDCVKMYGLKSREETVRILSQTSLMYLSLSDALRGVTPSRLFDILASGRPILAHLPAGSELEAQLAGTEHFIIEESNQAQAVDYLASLVARQSSGQLVIQPLPDYSLAHSWSNKAKQYAELLGRLV